LIGGKLKSKRARGPQALEKREELHLIPHKPHTDDEVGTGRGRQEPTA